MMNQIKVEYIDPDCIVFDNGKAIAYAHQQDCCEYNYADFMSIRDTAKYIDFNKLQYSFVDGFGFKVSDDQNPLIRYCNSIVIPCYSEQNSYYTDEIDIYECDVEWIPECISRSKLISDDHIRYSDAHSGCLPKLTNWQKVLSGTCAPRFN